MVRRGSARIITAQTAAERAHRAAGAGKPLADEEKRPTLAGPCGGNSRPAAPSHQPIRRTSSGAAGAARPAAGVAEGRRQRARSVEGGWYSLPLNNFENAQRACARAGADAARYAVSSQTAPEVRCRWRGGARRGRRCGERGSGPNRVSQCEHLKPWSRPFVAQRRQPAIFFRGFS